MSAHLRCASCGRVNRVKEERLSAHPKCGACGNPLDVANPPFHVTDDELDRLVQSSPVPVLVDFYADWCGPCRTLAPILEELARRHVGQLLVAKVDTERDQRNAGRLGVSGIPAMYLFRDGKVVNQATGARPLGAMESWVQPHL